MAIIKNFPGIRRFNSFERLTRNDPFSRGRYETIPAMNVTETKNNYLIELAVPGLKREDFDIDIAGNIITVSCEKETAGTEDEEVSACREYNYSSFSRTFPLPGDAAARDIVAKYEDGILSLEVPKKYVPADAQGRKIEVK